MHADCREMRKYTKVQKLVTSYHLGIQYYLFLCFPHFFLWNYIYFRIRIDQPALASCRPEPAGRASLRPQTGEQAEPRPADPSQPSDRRVSPADPSHPLDMCVGPVGSAELSWPACPRPSKPSRLQIPELNKCVCCMPWRFGGSLSRGLLRALVNWHTPPSSTPQ